MKVTCNRWGVRWVQIGEESFIVGGLDMLFNTKRQARAYIKTCFGYLAKRRDLRTPPHNWRMPQPVKIKITMEAE